MNRTSAPRIVAIYFLVTLVVCMAGVVSLPTSTYGDGTGSGDPPVKPPDSADSTITAPSQVDEADTQIRLDDVLEKNTLRSVMIQVALAVIL